MVQGLVRLNTSFWVQKPLAALDGRSTPLIEDVRNMAVPVLRHRIVTNFNAEAEGISAVDLIQKLLDRND